MDEVSKRFLDAAIERGWIDQETADECLRIQETVREVGVEQRIEEILVKKGFLSSEKTRELSRSLAARKIGKYEILEKLGEGGAGIVYRARQQPLDRVVAIKVLSQTRVDSQEYLDRFSREARTAVTLNHENIVRGLDYGEADGYHYFAMEYVEGESLMEVLFREGRLEESRALQLTLQTVHALIHAAEYNLVHRDIKPENILLTAEGVAKLCDLGLAKPTLAESAKASTAGGTIGTPLYMSPEQIRGKDETDFRADIYSLGITLYHLVTGRPPFRAKTIDDLIRMHLRQAPVDPREHCLELSASAAAVILKMIAKSPAERYPTLNALADDLQAVMDGRPPRGAIQVGAARPAGKVRIDLEDGAPRRSRRDAAAKKKSPVVLVVAIAAVVGIAAGVFFATQGGKENPKKTTAVDPTENGPEKPDVPDPGEVAYREAVNWLSENEGASFERKRNRFQLIVMKHPGTAWERTARDRIQEFEEDRDRAVKAHLDKARLEYETLLEEVNQHRAGSRFGEALAALTRYPKGYEDSEFPAKLKSAARELRVEAENAVTKAISEADSRAAAGEFDEAEKLLEALSKVGIPELTTSLEGKLDEIRAQRKTLQHTKERGRTHFRQVVGAAYSIGAGGAFREAEDALVKAGDDEKLALFRTDLDDAWRHLREARRFHSALVDGANALVGRTVRFTLSTRGSPEVSGKVAGIRAEGITLSGRSGDSTVPFRDILPLERYRTAFSVLDEEKADDRRAAALYFLVCADMAAADEEIEAAGMRGMDTDPLKARRGLMAEYYTGLAEMELRKGQRFADRGMRAEATDAFEKAVVLAPFYSAARLTIGSRLVNQGRYEEGLWELDRAAALGEKAPELSYFRGVALQQMRNREEAMSAFRAFLESADPGHAKRTEAKRRLGDLVGNVAEAQLKQLETEARDAFRRRNWDVAVAKYRLLLERDPEKKDSIYYIGKALVEKGEIFDGCASLRRYVVEVGSGRRVSGAKRDIRNLEKKWAGNDASRKAFEQGLSEFVSENYTGAVAHFDTALGAAPLDSRAYYQRGMSWLRMGELRRKAEDFQAALADFVRALVLDPLDALSREGLASCQYHLADYDRALKNARAVMKERPSGWVPYQVAGMVYLVRREYSSALEQLSEGIEAGAGQASLFLRRAEAYEGLERYTEAGTDLETAKRKDPTWEQLQEIKQIEERLATKR